MHCNSSIPSLPMLHPSTSMSRSVNIDRMETGYQHIVQSINNLAYQQLIRRGVDILSNIMRCPDMRRDGADEDVIGTYNVLIADLHEERKRSFLYNNYFSQQFENVINTDTQITSDDNDNTDSHNDSSTV